MQKRTGVRKLMLTAMAVSMLSLVGLEIAFAENPVKDFSQASGQWSLAAWYGLSLVLALIGFIAAKSRN